MISVSSMNKVFSSTLYKRRSAFTNVVLPVPILPTTPIDSPGRISILIFFNVGDDERDVLLSYKSDAIILEENDIEFLKEMNIVKVMFQNLDVSYLMSLENDLDSNLKGRIYYYVQKKKQNFVDAFGVLHDGELHYAFEYDHGERCERRKQSGCHHK